MTKTIVIYGPTTTGKTALALKLAKDFNGELISADSRQVYKKLDLGSGKVSFDSKVEKYEGFWRVNGIKIRGFDLVQSEDQFTAADFLQFCQKAINEITSQNKLPIIVGGTGFYIKSLIEGISSVGIASNPKLRSELEKLTREVLFQKLHALDPKRAKSMNQSDRLNPRRLIRAIEIASASNTPGVRSVAPKHTQGVYQIIGLTAPNEYIFRKSDTWLQERLKNGLIEEIEQLLKSSVSKAWLESLGLEYRWITRYLLGSITKDEAIKRLKGDTHNLIRRQKTWFPKLKGITLFDVTKEAHLNEVAKLTRMYIENGRR